MTVLSMHIVISIQNINKIIISTHVLLRDRYNRIMYVANYFGSVYDGGDISFLLYDCEDMTMEENSKNLSLQEETMR